VLVAGLVRPARVVRLAELVAAPDHGDPAPADHERVRQPESGYRLVTDRAGAQRLLGGLQPDQARGGAARAAVVVVGVVLEDQAAGARAVEVPGVPVGEEAPVRRAG